MFPSDQWVFSSLFVDNTNKIAYGFRYTVNANLTTTVVFHSITASEFSATTSSGAENSFYNIYSDNSTFYYGGDAKDRYCFCTMSYVRLYLNYVSKSPDEMINLAIMHPSSILQF